MAYKPSLNDISDSGGYKPSLSDIEQPQQKMQTKNLASEFLNKSLNQMANPDYTQAQSFLQGVAKGGQNIAKAFGASPDIDLTGVFGNKKTDTQAENIGQYLPTLVGGAAGLPGIIGSGLYGASQAKPGKGIEEGIYSALGSLGGNLLGKGGNAISVLFNKARGKLEPNEIAKIAQNAHNLMDQKSSKIFQDVGKQAYERGVDQVPIDMKVIKDVKKLLPKTSQNKELIQKAQSGDYNSLRKLQSDLGTRGSEAKLSKFLSDRDKGEKILDLRRKINDTVSNHFKNTGNQDLANSLKEGNNIYKNMQDIYYKDKRLGKLVHPEKLEVPNNISGLFSKNSKTMNKFRELHPEIKNSLNQLNTLKDLKKLGISGSLLGSGALLNHFLEKSNIPNPISETP